MANDILAQQQSGPSKYSADNERLQQLPQRKRRVVFMGDSITELWKMLDSDFFTSKSYICRGISGETTAEMLLRFPQDVLALKPKVTVIMGGTNDIAQNKGVIPLEDTFKNIVAMAQLAKKNNIRVILCSVLPAYDFPWHPGLHPAEQVIKLNAMIRAYANNNHIIYLDYFSAMADEKKGLKTGYSEDGVHPALAGYKVMEPLAVMAILKTLKRQ
jgi:lysophospholipase L1-like esterase